MEFKLHADYKPTGDQPQAIERLVAGFKSGKKAQTLLGVTGSGKTFTMANVIQQMQRPTLIISHNKTLAAQLHGEFKEYFPENAVEYFVSYYDYYQPEAYVPSTDTYIEKDSQINEEIDKLRHSATAALFERRDVIIVASVSCIYGLGSPFDYEHQMLSLRPGMVKSREEILRKLVDIQYTRNDMVLERTNFRARGDVIDIFPAGESNAVRVELFGDEIESIKEMNPVTGEIVGLRDHVGVFPATHYVTSPEKMEKALVTINEELEEQIQWFKDRGKLLEAQRIEQRTRYDLEMLREIGSCKGIENYSRHLNNLPPGSRPFTLVDYFPDDFIVMIDESHVMLPQLRAMYAGDRSRKQALVDYGFRLPSALDNRPLKFEEWESLINQIMFVSATPAAYEREHSEGITAEQVIRPTGLLDPKIDVRPTENQVDDLVAEINHTIETGDKAFVTTLTKKMAESLTDYLKNAGIRARYLHSEVDTLERLEIIRDLRLGNASGHVIMYGDYISKAMRAAIDETNRRRGIQEAYNKEHGITPTSIRKSVRAVIEATKVTEEKKQYKGKKPEELTTRELRAYVEQLEKEMRLAAEDLQFERAAQLRDQIFEYKSSRLK